ncbi:hypothetical protein VKT23_019558 [Stygiomarasmius scandens]|uniref:Uncharacterized protein n=1 Tax=Marasmiellus scandens TaxID=2682957 RepID=A0ABR1IL07_9AGAR
MSMGTNTWLYTARYGVPELSSQDSGSNTTSNVRLPGNTFPHHQSLTSLLKIGAYILLTIPVPRLLSTVSLDRRDIPLKEFQRGLGGWFGGSFLRYFYLGSEFSK